MLKIEIHHPSQKQLSKLRNGHTITVKKPIMQGQGLNLVVDPGKFQFISKTFGKGKSMRLQLTPTEIVSSELPKLTSAAQASFSQADSGAPNPVASPVGVVRPQTSVGMGLAPPRQVENMGPRNMIAPKTLHGAIDQNKMYEDMNTHFGRHYGVMQKAHVGNLLAGMSTSHSDQMLADAKDSGQFFGKGLYVGNPAAHNIGARHSARRPQRMIEGGSLGIHGGFIYHQPALESQPFSANFQFGTTLPVAYQKFSRGAGLYL